MSSAVPATTPPAPMPVRSGSDRSTSFVCARGPLPGPELRPRTSRHGGGRRRRPHGLPRALFESAGASGAGVVYVYERVECRTPVGTGHVDRVARPLVPGVASATRSISVARCWRSANRIVSVTAPNPDVPGCTRSREARGSSRDPRSIPAILGAENGDQFGASLAWVDGTILGDRCARCRADRRAVWHSSTTPVRVWNITDVTMPSSGWLRRAGDQFGFDIAAGELGSVRVEPVRRCARPRRRRSRRRRGVPLRRRRGRRHVDQQLRVRGQSWRVEASVDTSGDRAVAAGYGGGTLTVQILEYIDNPDIATELRPARSCGVALVARPSAWGSSRRTGRSTTTSPSTGRPSRSGGPGTAGVSRSSSVARQDGRRSPTSRSCRLADGPATGSATSIVLDGTVLVIGAPGDTGVTFEFPIPGPSTRPTCRAWRPGPARSRWHRPLERPRELGHPRCSGAADSAIVPPGVPPVEVDVDAVVARLVVDSNATVTVQNGFRLGSGSTLIRVNGIVSIQPGGEAALRNDATVDGRIIVEDERRSGPRTPHARRCGCRVCTGRLTVFGQAQKTGPGTAAVDVERILTYPTTAVGR